MILFRADGNEHIGSGHVMRCLSIADAASARGEDCLFVTADGLPREMIADRGYHDVVLHTDYRDLPAELPQMERLLMEYAPTALVVDSYYVMDGYLKTLRDWCGKRSCKLACLDDTMSFPYSCDLLINYNIFAFNWKSEYTDMYSRAGMPCPQLLLGTSFAPLRKEFRGLPARDTREFAQDILISTGASDPAHITKALIEGIEGRDDLSAFRFHVVLGAMNGDAGAIRRMTENMPHIMLHQNVHKMQPLMSAMDVAISAAGSTLYELCATQTPAVTFILADNQVPLAEEFARRGILRCVGDARTQDAIELTNNLVDEVVRLSSDCEERRLISERQRSVVDGNGAGRLAAVITGNTER